MDEIETGMAGWIRWTLVGYLAEKTGQVWQVELRRQMLDVDILCTCGGFRASAGNVTLEKVNSELDLLVSLLSRMDVVVATFYRLAKESVVSEERKIDTHVFIVEVDEELDPNTHHCLASAVYKIPYEDRHGATEFVLLEAGEANNGVRQLTIQATFDPSQWSK
jgi:hypothetical protein